MTKIFHQTYCEFLKDWNYPFPGFLLCLSHLSFNMQSFILYHKVINCFDTCWTVSRKKKTTAEAPYLGQKSVYDLLRNVLIFFFKLSLQFYSDPKLTNEGKLAIFLIKKKHQWNSYKLLHYTIPWKRTYMKKWKVFIHFFPYK